MAEIGIDIAQEFPKPMTDEVVKAADAVITMGCGDSCPIYPGKRYEDWEVTDPADLDLDGVRQVRDEIRDRVTALLDELVSTTRQRAASRMDSSLPLARRALAEGLAAFALVFAGCGAIVSNEVYGGALGAVGVSLVFGLIIMVMVYATGHLSGAHINPAVTIAFALTRHFPRREAAAYIGGQLAGAVAGSARAPGHVE